MTTVEVYLAEGDRSVAVGRAHFTLGRRDISTTFIYDDDYLAKGRTNIDPALQLTTGPQHQTGLLRAFADTAPDRWGRNLLDKNERVRARAEHRAPRTLTDLDYLLGVSDDTRQGALRFKFPDRDEFLGEPAKVPQLISLPQLIRASEAMASSDDSAAAVKQLLDTGTTGLGGARPKASVRLQDQSLAIAKFPHPSDRWNVMAWENIALDLAEAAGIQTPVRRLTQVGDRSVLLLRRFDRGGEPDQRIGYISAMTAIGANDGDQRDYSDIALAIRDLSRAPHKDLQELFARVTLSVALGNTDDHLRNHGFLASQQSWVLSPIFDINPTPDLNRARATTIAGADTVPDEVDGLLALAGDCSLSIEQATTVLQRVSASMADWRTVALRNGVSPSEIVLMAESIEPRIEALTAVLV